MAPSIGSIRGTRTDQASAMGVTVHTYLHADRNCLSLAEHTVHCLEQRGFSANLQGKVIAAVPPDWKLELFDSLLELRDLFRVNSQFMLRMHKDYHLHGRIVDTSADLQFVCRPDSQDYQASSSSLRISVDFPLSLTMGQEDILLSLMKCDLVHLTETVDPSLAIGWAEYWGVSEISVGDEDLDGVRIPKKGWFNAYGRELVDQNGIRALLSDDVVEWRILRACLEIRRTGGRIAGPERARGECRWWRRPRAASGATRPT